MVIKYKCLLHFEVSLYATLLLSLFLLFFFPGYLGPHLWHMEVLRLGIESELQLPAYTTATATCNLSHVCDLYPTSWQHQILNPLSEARGGTCILMDTSRNLSTVPQWELPCAHFLSIHSLPYRPWSSKNTNLMVLSPYLVRCNSSLG